jgi:PHD/YefM family antitoxin component YafN of YafNO toxin-antitoxin module
MIRKLKNEPVTARSFQPTAVHPLTDFKRNTTEFRERLKSTGRPEVLTVDGRADLVVLDVQAYQKLMDELERLETIDAIRQGLLDIEKGRTRPLAEVEAEMRAELNFPPRRK